MRRQVEDGLPRVIELRRQPDLPGAPDAEPSAHVVEGPSTVSVADVSIVAVMRSSSSSRTIADTSIGDARRKTPRPRISR